MRKWAVIASGLFWVTFAPPVHGQACCAAGVGLSPARLGLHERFGVGVTLRASWSFGRHDSDARYVPVAPGTRELGFAQDLFAALRWLERGQVALLLPFVQTYRRSRVEASSGYGIGDVNLTARYDWIWGSRYRYVPGIALLAGLTLPTGTPPERAVKPLRSDATGRGVYQAQVGVALEKSFGPSVLSLAALAGFRSRAEFAGLSLASAPELRLLGTYSYVLPEEQVIGLSVSLTSEGNSRVNGAVAADSARRELQLGAYAVLPLAENVRLRLGAAAQPPLDGLGRNQPAALSAFTGVNWSHP